MKKTALILLLVLALSLVFAGCNQTEQTESIPRWGNEQYTFNITKADFESSAVFNNETFVKEPFISAYEINPERMDELVPEDVSGTYVTKIQLSADETQCTYTTQQTLYVQYKTETLTALASYNEIAATLQTMTIAPDSEENPFSEHEGLTTLKSTTDTEVVFLRESSQRPLSSKTVVNGFYLGKTHQEISLYDVTTTYDWENGSAKVVYNNRADETKSSTATNKLNYSSATKIIDANQVLLFARSLEKTSTKFQDNPGVQIYQPLNNTVYVASFFFTYSNNTMLTNAENQSAYVKLNSLSVIVNDSVLVTQLNLPDTVNSDNKNLDSISIGSGKTLNKYTTVRFRSGVYSYQLVTIEQDILDAVTVKAEAEE